MLGLQLGSALGLDLAVRLGRACLAVHDWPFTCSCICAIHMAHRSYPYYTI